MKSLALITNFYPPQVGGIEEYLRQFVLRYPGNLLLITPNDVEQPLPPNVTHLKLPFFSPRPIFPSWLPFIVRLRRELKGREIQEIVLGHLAPYAPGIAVVARVLRIPWSTILHGVDFFQWDRSTLRAWLRLRTLRTAHLIIANSEYLAEEARRAGVRNTQITIASPGIDARDFYPDRPKRFFAKRGLLGKRILLSVGRLIPRKGFATTIAAFARVHQEIPESILVLIGDGPERVKLTTQAQELGLSEEVRFLGELRSTEERRQWYSAADCFVMPTRIIGDWDTESFGIVYLEALACGTPIIASELGGVREILQPGKNGFFAGDGTNPGTVAQRILDILQNPAVQRSLVSRARESVVPRYTWEQQLNQLFIVWNSY